MNVSANDYVYFVLDGVHHGNASFGFKASYTDKKGNFHILKSNTVSKTTGEKVARKIKFTRAQRTFRVHVEQKEILEFMRNHPSCKDSPNGSYRSNGDGTRIQSGIWFSEINESRDAEKAIDIRIKKNKAGGAILELAKDPQALLDFGQVIGYNSDKTKIVMFKLMEHADRNPAEILEELESDHLPEKILFKIGVSKGIIVKKGLAYKLEDFELGYDEDTCVKTIATDSSASVLLQRKLGREVPAKKKGKK